MISILVPVHNAGPHLSATIASLLAQEGETFEIIVCDDGSTDDSGRIAERYAADDSRVQYFRQSRAGAAAARNAALSSAHGEWILFVDADDYLRPGSLRAMGQSAREHPRDIVYCGWSKFDDDPRGCTPGALPLGDEIPGWLWVTRSFERDYPTYPGCFLVPRTVIAALGGWNEELSFQDDMEFFARIISPTGTIRYCDDALFCYRQGVPGSLSNTPGRRSSESQWLATRLAVEHLLKVKDTPRTRAAAVRQIMLVSYAQYVAAPDISREAEAYATHLASGIMWRPWLPGGTFRRVAQALLGWKLALRVHRALRR